MSKIFPTGGIDGTNKYTLETAIAMIPASLRNVGIKCSFINEAGELETWEYKQGGYSSLNNWGKVGITTDDLQKQSSSANTYYPFGSQSKFYINSSNNVGMTAEIAKQTFFGIYISKGEKAKLHIDTINKTASNLNVIIANEDGDKILQTGNISLSDELQILRLTELNNSGYAGYIAIVTNGFTSNTFASSFSTGLFELSENIFIEQNIFSDIVKGSKSFDLYRGYIPFNVFSDIDLENITSYCENYGGSTSSFSVIEENGLKAISVSYKTNIGYAFSLNLNKIITAETGIDYYTTVVVKAKTACNLSYVPLSSVSGTKTNLLLSAGEERRITVQQKGNTGILFLLNPRTSEEGSETIRIYPPIVEKQVKSENNRVLGAKTIMDALISTYGDFSQKKSVLSENLNSVPDFNLISTQDTRFGEAGFAAINGSSSFEFVTKDGFTWIRATKEISSSYLGIITGFPLLEAVAENQPVRVAIIFYCESQVSISIDSLEGKRNYRELSRGYNILDFDATPILNDERNKFVNMTVIAQDTKFPVGESLMFLPLYIYYGSSPSYHLLYHSVFNRYEGNKLYNKKFVFAGDSITVQQQWVKYLEKVFPPLLYGKEISASNIGESGNSPTAVGGSTLMPIVTNGTGTASGQSLFERSKCFKNYNPDIIIIYIGANDMGLIAPYDSYDEVEKALLKYKEDNPDYNPSSNKWWLWEGSIPLGNVEDPAYTDNEITIDIKDASYGAALFKYNSDSTSIDWRVPKELTFASAYKGMLDRLTSEMHGVKIFLCTNTPFYAQGYDTIPDQRYDAQKAMAQKVREIAEYYSLPVIDNWKNAGITRFNYRKTGEERPFLADGIHPSELGGEMIGFNIANALGL